MEVMTLERVLPLATRLSVLDKVRLIEKITPQITLDLEAKETVLHPRSLWGLSADLGNAPSMEDIEEVRREMWANFPRELIGNEL